MRNDDRKQRSEDRGGFDKWADDGENDGYPMACRPSK